MFFEIKYNMDSNQTVIYRRGDPQGAAPVETYFNDENLNIISEETFFTDLQNTELSHVVLIQGACKLSLTRDRFIRNNVLMIFNSLDGNSSDNTLQVVNKNIYLSCTILAPLRPIFRFQNNQINIFLYEINKISLTRTFFSIWWGQSSASFDAMMQSTQKADYSTFVFSYDVELPTITTTSLTPVGRRWVSKDYFYDAPEKNRTRLSFALNSSLAVLRPASHVLTNNTINIENNKFALEKNIIHWEGLVVQSHSASNFIYLNQSPIHLQNQNNQFRIESGNFYYGNNLHQSLIQNYDVSSEGNMIHLQGNKNIFLDLHTTLASTGNISISMIQESNVFLHDDEKNENNKNKISLQGSLGANSACLLFQKNIDQLMSSYNQILCSQSEVHQINSQKDYALMSKIVSNSQSNSTNRLYYISNSDFYSICDYHVKNQVHSLPQIDNIECNQSQLFITKATIESSIKKMIKVTGVNKLRLNEINISSESFLSLEGQSSESLNKIKNQIIYIYNCKSLKYNKNYILFNFVNQKYQFLIYFFKIDSFSAKLIVGSLSSRTAILNLCQFSGGRIVTSNFWNNGNQSAFLGEQTIVPNSNGNQIYTCAKLLDQMIQNQNEIKGTFYRNLM